MCLEDFLESATCLRISELPHRLGNLNDELIVLAELLMSVITGPFTVIVIILTSHPLICTMNQSKFSESNQMEVAISIHKVRMNHAFEFKLLC